MHWVLCQLKAMVATTEVMPWKGNGALLFPLSTLKHKWLHWTICLRKPGWWRSKAVWRPPGISLGTRHVLEGWEALRKGAEGVFLSFPPWASWEHKLFNWETAFTFIVMFFQHSEPHSDILYTWIYSNILVGILRTPWNLGIMFFVFVFFVNPTFFVFFK